MASMVHDDQYEGREQALAKHTLLEKYLEKLFFIVGNNSNRNKIINLNYVDCFAGPWLDESQNLSASSIAISLGVLIRVKNTLIKNGYKIQMRALFIEKNIDSANKGKIYLNSRKKDDIEAEYIIGDFTENVSEILAWCGKDFTFFFIDPKGYISITLDILQPLLMRKRSEFLINFMYEFIGRNAGMESQKKNIENLLGEKIEIKNLNPEQREILILQTFRKNIKLTSKMPRSWSGYSRVINPEKNRTKYHLVYFTTHPLGMVKFSEISDVVDDKQKKIRSKIHEDKLLGKHKNMELFGGSGDAYVETVSLDSKVDDYWLNNLTDIPKRITLHDFANILEETDWSPRLLQQSLLRLVSQGKVENLDLVGRRPVNFLHYDKQNGERLRKIT
jgi:three-Cys-motif partner protein